jgi:hypothetical protein
MGQHDTTMKRAQPGRTSYSTLCRLDVAPLHLFAKSRRHLRKHRLPLVNSLPTKQTGRGIPRGSRALEAPC